MLPAPRPRAPDAPAQPKNSDRMLSRDQSSDLHFQCYGEGDPVLLIHGFPLSGEMWTGAVGRRRDGWRLIVPDLRGHGRSPTADSASMALYARDLVRLLDSLGEGRPAVVVGMSMGGYVALELFRSFRERVRALVLVDTRARRDSPEAAQARYEAAERVLEHGSGAVAGDLVHRLFAPSTSSALKEEWKERMAGADRRSVAAALRAMAVRRDSRRLLRRVQVPVLVVVGAEDVISPPSEAREMAELAPAGRVRVIPRAGHMLPVERPDEFATALFDFLDDLRRQEARCG
jgi:3-oxoadipate enol-lactonase